MTALPRSVMPAAHLMASTPSASWDLASMRGRLVELIRDGCGASLSAALEVVREAQEASEPAAWISAGTRLCHPVDVVRSGVDPGALAIVRAPSALAALRAAGLLLRSSGFGVVVLDLGRAPALPQAELGRLLKLARQHDVAVVCLTVPGGGCTALGSLVSLRARTARRRLGSGCFACTLSVLKDKRRGPGWSVERVATAPPGLP